MMLLGVELTLKPFRITIPKSQKPEKPSSPGNGLKPVRVDAWFDKLFLLVSCRKYPLLTINRDVAHDRLIVRNGGPPEETGGDGVRAVPMFQINVLHKYLQDQLTKDRVTVTELGFKPGECFLIEPLDNNPIVVHVTFNRDPNEDSETSSSSAKAAAHPTSGSRPADNIEWVRLRFHHPLPQSAT